MRAAPAHTAKLETSRLTPLMLLKGSPEGVSQAGV